MDTFKLKTGASVPYTIDKQTFEDLTFKRPPYYQKNSEGDIVQYAVCPQCDNPIQIIGLYKKSDNTDKPYGRHCPKSIQGLAVYNQQSYDYCIYANPNNKTDKSSRKSRTTNFEINIYNLMRDQFDRIIYILEKELDIKISINLAKRMLKDYVDSEGWLYSWATINNLPWVLGYLSLAKSLYMQPVLKGSALYNAILNNCPTAKFIPYEYNDKYVILTNKDRQFINIEFCIINHQKKLLDNKLTETMDLVVRDNTNEKDKRFFTKKIIINQNYLLNLINYKSEKVYRNEKLLSIAKSLMTK